MSYNYLGLVNDVCGRVNETQLTATTFNAASGFYSTAKEAVNSSIREINQQVFEWPFNHNTQNDTLVAGTSRYTYPSDTKSVDFDSFRIQRDAALGNSTVKLRLIDYDQYLESFVDDEYSTDTSTRDLPKYVFRTPDRKYGVHPVPDQAYTLTYEYYNYPTDLSSSSDVPSFPEAFRHVIVDGAMSYVYNFRGDTETGDRLRAQFTNGVDRLRTIFVNNDYEYVRDTRITRSPLYQGKVLRVS